MPDPKNPISPPPVEQEPQADDALQREWAREQELVDDPETGSASGFGQTEGR